jgi:Valyl-tRNA synthetase
VFMTLLKLWHPFMPFVTEVLWEKLGGEGLLMIAPWPKPYGESDIEAEKIMSGLQDIVSAIRSIRADYKVSMDKFIEAVVEAPLYAEEFNAFEPVIKMMTRVEKLRIAGEIAPPEQSATVTIGANTISIPLAGLIDFDKEKKRISDDIIATKKFAAGIEARLNNQEFVGKAPEKVVEGEKSKLAEAKAKLEKLEAQLEELK